MTAKQERRPAVRLKDREHALVREIADVEGRTIVGVLTLAVRMYAQRKQPTLLRQWANGGAS